MSTDNDDAVPLAIFLAAGVAAAVIAGVMAIAVFARPKSAAMPTAAATAAVAVAPATQAAPIDPGAAVPVSTVENLYFASGSADLPADASEKIARVADAARAGAGTTVLIAGYHDSTGKAAKNAELAKQRASAVRHALEANGVAPESLQMSKPLETAGGGDPKEARRVELRLQ